MNIIKNLRLTLPLVFTAVAFSQPSVAVLDFAANGLPEYEVETLVERLRSELPNTGAVRLVDRKMLENILKEQGCNSLGVLPMNVLRRSGSLVPNL